MMPKTHPRGSRVSAVPTGTMDAQLKRRGRPGVGSTVEGGLCTHQSDSTGKAGGVTMMLSQPSDENPQARETLFDVASRMAAPFERHWFVNDTEAPGYCAACGLPRHNTRRHCERAA